MQEKFFDGERQQVVFPAEFVVKPRAQSGRGGRGQLTGSAKKSTVFARERKDRKEELDVEALCANGKVVFVGFAGGEEAHRSWSASVASAAVSRPVQTVDDIDEMRTVVSMAGEAESRGILHFLNLDRRCFELS